jgi:hypothetical protein
VIERGIAEPLRNLFECFGGTETEGWDLHRSARWGFGIELASSGKPPSTAQQNRSEQKED